MALLNTAKKVYAGSTVAKVVYKGTSKIWPSWTPKSVTGLVVWLDASQLPLADGAVVSPWTDLSGTGHHGTIAGTPAPKMSTNKLNGLALVRFTVSEGRVRGTTGLKDANPTIGGYNYTVTYVARMLGNPGRIFTVPYPPENFLIGFHSQGWDWFYDNGNVGGGSVGYPGWPSPWKLYTGTANHDGTNYRASFFINGVQKGTDAASGGGMGNYYNLSGYAATEETCDCEVAELVVYNRRLSDTERQQVESYLKTKWGV